MMAKRKPLSASLRWSVFARDGFCCRYCGAQAGQDGVELAADHVLSVADGGDNSYDNLVTACQKCNGGKGAKSLSDIPTPEQVVDRVRAMRGRLDDLANEMQAVSEAHDEIGQRVVDIKCRAYGVDSVTMSPTETGHALRLVSEFGADALLEWYMAAALARVSQWQAIKYVHGCARKTRARDRGEADA